MANVVLLEETLPSIVGRRKGLGQTAQPEHKHGQQTREAGPRGALPRLRALLRGGGYSRLRGGGEPGGSGGCAAKGGVVGQSSARGPLGRTDSAADYRARRGGSSPYGCGGDDGKGLDECVSRSSSSVNQVELAPLAARGQEVAAGCEPAARSPAAQCQARAGNSSEGSGGGAGGGSSRCVERVDSSWLLRAYRQTPVEGRSRSSGCIRDGGRADTAAASTCQHQPLPTEEACCLAHSSSTTSSMCSRGVGSGVTPDSTLPVSALPPTARAAKVATERRNCDLAAEADNSKCGEELQQLLPADVGGPQHSVAPGPADDGLNLNPAPGGDERPWYRRGQVVLALLGYGAVCLLFSCLDEMVPIFASAPRREGGRRLGLRSQSK